ncbi:Protein NRT1/ PTR FAMILY 6.2 [Ananas comosus]|uniref:Protein NRT1/ PTR FAMILY 6.2 n=1 Tax=Ananas comosus TaxID=4615 RepID=A0A199V4X7_ANACO|nr:Protein NRT1/ PTR FAMILY 6.2 [Ananas comosus]
MKTMSTGLFLTTLSVGFFFSSFLVSIVKNVTGGKDGMGWLADNINQGRLDCFYGLLAGLSAINLGSTLYVLLGPNRRPLRNILVTWRASSRTPTETTSASD